MEANEPLLNSPNNSVLSGNCREALLKLDEHFNNNNYLVCCRRFSLLSYARNAKIGKRSIYIAHLYTLVEQRWSSTRNAPYTGNETCPNSPIGDIWQDYEFDLPKTTILDPPTLCITENLPKTQRQEECPHCNSSEQIQCSHCKGDRYIVTWNQLNVKRFNHYSKILFPSNNHNFCPEHIIEAASNKIKCLEFDDILPMNTKSLDNILNTCNGLPEGLRNEINNKFLEHKRADKVLRLKCTIECLQINRIDYQLKGLSNETFTFHLIGENKQLHISQYSYPSNSQQCHSACCLM